MSLQSQTPTSGQAPMDRYESTFVVSQKISKGDFTSVQPAIDALPAAGGKIFVKAGVYPLSNSIRVTKSNIQIQGEGMGITNFVAASTMTGNTPALEAFSSASDGTPRALIGDTARGDTTIRLDPADASSFTIADYVLLFSNNSGALLGPQPYGRAQNSSRNPDIAVRIRLSMIDRDFRS